MAADLSRSPPEKRKRYHFLLSSFTQEEREELKNAIQALGGIYTETAHFVSSSSHIVCKKPNRGEKFLCGCATGKWIVNKEYIIASAKAQRWLDEDDYEWNKNSSFTGIPPSHVSAPMRWRKNYNLKQRGPFHGWKTLVAIKDMKRKFAYKRLLDAGQATVLNAKPPFQAHLLQRVTHVFVEKAMEEDVECFRAAGIPCLSPDYIPEYILQDPIPSLDDFSTFSYFTPKPIPKTVTREPANQFITPVYPPGDCGAPKTKSRINDIKIKKQGQKRQAEPILIDDHPSPPKKLKEVKHCEEIFPNWLEWHSSSPWILNKDLTTCERPSNLSHNKSKKPVSTFPTYVVNAIDSYLEEEGHESIVLSTIASFLSSTQHPAPSLVYTIINRFLLKASTPQLASQAYMVLQHLLSLHPPPVRSYLYQQAMQCPERSSAGLVKSKSSAWEFLSNIFSLALEVKNGKYIKGCTPRQTRDNSLLLIKFLCGVFEKDFVAVKEKRECSGTTYQHKELLIWKVIWTDGQGASVNCIVRQLLKLLWISAKQSQEDNDKIPVLLALQSLVAMVAACFEYMDQSTNGTNTSDAKVGSRMVSLATELVLTCSRSHDQEGSLKMLLDSCHPAWLKMHVLDIFMHSYDDRLVPQERKHLLAQGLSMEKIVCCYFFLLPVSSASSPAMDVENTAVESDGHVLNKDSFRPNAALRLITDANTYHSMANDLHKEPMKLKKLMVNKRNVRGETPLHKAAIKNEPSKIRELIDAGADVNLTDHAGWTPLHEACNHGNVACVEEILKVRPLVYESMRNEGVPGLYILASPLCGTTPLHDAVANNHMDVAKLLLEAGGLPLLQAQNAEGLTPQDISTSEVMATYLKTMELNLLNKTAQTLQTKENGEQSSIVKVPSDKEYRKVLGKKGFKLAHMSENCQVYLLLLSHLVQSYARLYNLGHIRRPDVNNDDTCDKGLQESMDNSILLAFSSHVEKLKSHLSKITSGCQLSPLCQSRLEAMKFI